MPEHPAVVMFPDDSVRWTIYQTAGGVLASLLCDTRADAFALWERGEGINSFADPEEISPSEAVPVEIMIDGFDPMVLKGEATPTAIVNDGLDLAMAPNWPGEPWFPQHFDQLPPLARGAGLGRTLPGSPNFSESRLHRPLQVLLHLTGEELDRAAARISSKADPRNKTGVRAPNISRNPWETYWVYFAVDLEPTQLAALLKTSVDLSQPRVSLERWGDLGYLTLIRADEIPFFFEELELVDAQKGMANLRARSVMRLEYKEDGGQWILESIRSVIRTLSEKNTIPLASFYGGTENGDPRGYEIHNGPVSPFGYGSEYQGEL